MANSFDTASSCKAQVGAALAQSPVPCYPNEVDPVNFLPRITVPTLMLNGRYDFFFPVETSQVPMFRLLGTRADQKRYVVEDGSHFVARTRLIQEMLGWLDKYQPLPQ